MTEQRLDWIRQDYSEFELFKHSLLTDEGRLPYLKSIGAANAHTIPRIGAVSGEADRDINMSGYDYLGLNECAAVHGAAKVAIDRYGVSTAASRLVSGELDIHRELESKLATFLGAEDCIVMVSGHGTNVTTVGHLFGPEHTLVCDQYAHNSIEVGAQLSGATVVKFRHNDASHLESVLQQIDTKHTAVCIEGLYSMDGDLPPLPEILALKERYGFAIYLDEAHSIGTLGATGRGVCEHFGIDPHLIDVRMGTLSKTFASCGGYVVGSSALIEYLKLSSPGFIFSTGLPAPLAAAALAALDELIAHPEYPGQIQSVAQRFSTRLLGKAQSTPIVPLPISPDNAFATGRLCQEAGVRVFPITYPAVSRSATRLRFFLSRLHTDEQLATTVETVHRVLDAVADRSSTPVLHARP